MWGPRQAFWPLRALGPLPALEPLRALGRLRALAPLRALGPLQDWSLYGLWSLCRLWRLWRLSGLGVGGQKPTKRQNIQEMTDTGAMASKKTQMYVFIGHYFYLLLCTEYTVHTNVFLDNRFQIRTDT